MHPSSKEDWCPGLPADRRRLEETRTPGFTQLCSRGAPAKWPPAYPQPEELVLEAVCPATPQERNGRLGSVSRSHIGRLTPVHGEFGYKRPWAVQTSHGNGFATRTDQVSPALKRGGSRLVVSWDAQLA